MAVTSEMKIQPARQITASCSSTLRFPRPMTGRAALSADEPAAVVAIRRGGVQADQGPLVDELPLDLRHRGDHHEEGLGGARRVVDVGQGAAEDLQAGAAFGEVLSGDDELKPPEGQYCLAAPATAQSAPTGRCSAPAACA